jgi:Sulfotransferase family
VRGSGAYDMTSGRALTSSEGENRGDIGAAQLPAMTALPPHAERNRSPVFVLGCPRSGTTLLYHMLLSAGGFAVYRTESSVFNVLKPWFGNLAVQGNRRRLMDAWLRSKLFERSGLGASDIRAKVMAGCHGAGDFLRIIMEEMSRRQNVDRWADCTPEHLLYIPEIKKAFPNALVIHMIRDGRDVALSLEKQRWIRPLSSRTGSGLLVAGLYWEWMVTKGREHGRNITKDYIEVRFEDLIQAPQETLRSLSAFIEQDLDYDQIQERAIGSVKKPNTSFEMESAEGEFDPVSRWKSGFPPRELEKLELMIGHTLRELGYIPSPERDSRRVWLIAMRNMCRLSFGSKLWMKRHTSLGRILMRSDLTWL